LGSASTIEETAQVKRVNRPKTFGLLTVLSVALMSLAACGGNDAEGSTTTNSEGRLAQRTTLTVAVPTGNATYAPAYVAMAEGFFDKYNLDMKFEVAGSLTATRLAAGDVDLAVNSTVDLILAGQDVKVVRGQLKDPGLSLIANSDIKSLDDLAHKQDCRIVTYPPGTSPYAYVNMWNKQFDLGCKIGQVPDAATILSGVQSGSITAAGLNPQVIAGAPNINVLIDVTKPDFWDKYAMTEHMNVFWLGNKDSLEKKRAAVVAFLKGYDEGLKFVLDPSNHDAVVADVFKEADWAKGQSTEYVAGQVDFWKQFYWQSSTDQYGNLTSDEWSAFLTNYETYYGAPGFKADNPAIAYDKAVDMSYFDEATG
jgi:ABC-type nitrate/sulfonate/bicarbonate transport system substrate-binding protein